MRERKAPTMKRKTKSSLLNGVACVLATLTVMIHGNVYVKRTDWGNETSAIVFFWVQEKESTTLVSELNSLEDSLAEEFQGSIAQTLRVSQIWLVRDARY